MGTREIATIQATHKDTYSISGVINFHTVMALLQKIDALFNQATKEIVFDFSGTTKSNSAAIALLLTLLRKADLEQKIVRFLHLPTNLLAAAKISDLDLLLCPLTK